MVDEQEQKLADALERVGVKVAFWRDHEPVPEPDIDTLELLAKRFKEEEDWRGPMTSAIESGDALACDIFIEKGDRAVEAADGQGALQIYRQAIESAPRPIVDAQLGALLLRRVGAQEAPLSHLDFDETCLSFELDDALLEGPIMPPPTRRPLVELALDAYGRAYGYGIWSRQHQLTKSLCLTASALRLPRLITRT